MLVLVQRGICWQKLDKTTYHHTSYATLTMCNGYIYTVILLCFKYRPVISLKISVRVNFRSESEGRKRKCYYA